MCIFYDILFYIKQGLIYKKVHVFFHTSFQNLIFDLIFVPAVVSNRSALREND